ncbi:MAG TPA: hypothetical protein PK671_16165, partial [Candidatus Obscuribacter sp.]|nr:hypothetical protein [Candidatus Obscuribacter sp.]
MHTEPGPSSVVCRRKLFSTWLSVVCLALSGSSAQAQTAADTGASSQSTQLPSIKLETSSSSSSPSTTQNGNTDHAFQMWTPIFIDVPLSRSRKVRGYFEASPRLAYGYGDGGGGPTREMLENIEVMGHFPGLPQVKQSSVKDFFESLELALQSRRMPTWNGELYLEYHRGTYTTQSRNKRANR